MTLSIASAADVQSVLAPLSLRQIERLADLSGVPATTIYKIKRGETSNPGVETVRRFLPFVGDAMTEADPTRPHADGRPAIDVAAPAVKEAA